MSLELPPPRSISQSEYDFGFEKRLNIQEVGRGALIIFHYSELIALTLSVLGTRLSQPESSVFLMVKFNDGDKVIEFDNGAGLPFILETSLLRSQPNGSTGYLLNSPEDGFDRSVSAMLDEEAAASRVFIGV